MRRQIKLTATFVVLFVAMMSFQTLQATQLLNQDSSDKFTTENPAGNDSSKNARVVASLVGKWENPYFALESGKDSNARYLKYQFREDGTYIKMLGGAETQVEETGTWEISEDGSQLLMRSRSLCDGKVMTTSATIKHLSMDELVLEQTMCVAGVMITSEPQDFYFNKF